MNGIFHRLSLIIATLMVSGCASQVPIPISTTPAANLSVAEVRADIDRFKGSEVRWGGVITRIDNQASHTWIEIVSHELSKRGEPNSGSQSSGRFIASFEGFIDPLVYGNGRLLTVAGTVTEVTTRNIGEYSYTFPVVTVTSSHLWPIEIIEPPYPDYPPPWWYYDPWPFYPRPFPYHPHYH